LIDAVFVPRGPEERAVRRALRRAGNDEIVVVTCGIGSQAAARAVRGAATLRIRRALAAGLCGVLSPAFVVGDALVYRDVRTQGDGVLTLDRGLSDALAARLTGAQSGIVALAVDRIVTQAHAKHVMRERYGADAVDMETWAIACGLQEAGVAVAALRVGSDTSDDDLPDLDSAVSSDGSLSGLTMARACARQPRAGVKLAWHGMRALRALERAVFDVVRAA